MTFSLYRYFDTVLDAVEDGGLAAFDQSEVQKALAEMNTFLPPLSNVAQLVFSYHCVYQLEPKPVAGSEVGKALNLPALYLEHTTAWQELTQLGQQFLMGCRFLERRVVTRNSLFNRQKTGI